MSTRSHERTQERRMALQVLYQSEILGMTPEQIIVNKQLVDEDALLGNYAKELLVGTNNNAAVIDGYLNSTSENWALDRMPLVDKSLLRITTYEMKYVDEVPISVSINEAVNLAKEFGGEDSPRFINGVLGRIARMLEEEQVANRQSEQPVNAQDLSKEILCEQSQDVCKPRERNQQKEGFNERRTI